MEEGEDVRRRGGCGDEGKEKGGRRKGEGEEEYEVQL